MSRPALRLLTVAGAVAATIGLTALPALAHVTVSSPDATQGGYGSVTFRVPTESESASTTGLKVQFPADAPFGYVGVKPKAGWTYTVTKAKLATPVKTDDGEVTDYTAVVEWKAATPAAGIKPGEFDEFELVAGPMPKASSVVFKAIQTYSDGKVVSWIEEPAAGGAEPDYPAPMLKLAAATGTGVTAPAAPPAGTDAASKGSVTGAYVLGGLGLVAGLGGLALGARRRRTTVEEPDRATASTGVQ